MPGMHDIFGPGSNISRRVLRDYGELAKLVESCRGLGMRIVLTSGTYDLFHVGHSRYLEKARNHGDVLIVGVDSDEKVRRRKGPTRPIVPEDERMEILCHNRHVDLVFLKGADDPRWHLIKTVRPDVIIAVKDTYPPEEVEALNEFCGQVTVLEYQATTSTTAKIRLVLVQHVEEIKTQLDAALDDARQRIHSVLDGLTGGDS